MRLRLILMAVLLFTAAAAQAPTYKYKIVSVGAPSAGKKTVTWEIRNATTGALVASFSNDFAATATIRDIRQDLEGRTLDRAETDTSDVSNTELAAPPAPHTHVMTKADVGLGNVDNTSDANKPVSVAQQAAIDAKLAVSDVATTPVASKVPRADGAGKIDAGWIPVLNQNTTGTAAGLASAYIDWNASSSGPSILNKPVLVNPATLGAPISFQTTTAPACSSGGTTTFIGQGNASTTENTAMRFIVPYSGTLRNFRVRLGAAVPTGETVTVVLSKNGSTTGSPSITVAAAAQTGSENATGLSVAAGDLISVSFRCAGGTTAITAPVVAMVTIQ